MKVWRDNMGYVYIETKRLKLVPLGMKYLESTHAYAMDLENTKYMLHLPNDDISDTKAYLMSVEENWKKECQNDYAFAILLDGVHIGVVSLYIYENERVGEFGWLIIKKYWRKGYALEAAKGLLDYAARELGLRKFCATCDRDNVGSRAIMERLGMHLVSETYGRVNKASDEVKFECRYEVELGM